MHDKTGETIVFIEPREWACDKGNIMDTLCHTILRDIIIYECLLFCRKICQDTQPEPGLTYLTLWASVKAREPLHNKSRPPTTNDKLNITSVIAMGMEELNLGKTFPGVEALLRLPGSHFALHRIVPGKAFNAIHSNYSTSLLYSYSPVILTQVQDIGIAYGILGRTPTILLFF